LRDSSTTVEEELSALLSVVGQRRAAIAARRLGWDGLGGTTLEVAGKEYDVTRERVRQIIEKFKDKLQWKLRRKTLSTPALDRMLEFVSASSPAPAEEVESKAVQLKLTKSSFRLEGLLTAAELLRRKATFSVVHIGCRYVVPLDQAELINRVLRIARRGVEHWGAATVDDLVAEVSKQLPVTPDFAARVLTGSEGFQWLEQSRGWFWFRSVPRNRLVNQIRKIVSVARKIDVSELRGGVGRHHRMRGFAPPSGVLLELCRSIPGLHTDGNVVGTDHQLSWEKVLSGTERIFVRILLESGPVMSREELEQRCLKEGMKRATFYIYLDYSPVLAKYARGVYGLRGASIEPGVVDQLMTHRRRGKVLRDYGWTTRGDVWLAFRLSDSTIANGVVSVPTAMGRYVQGDFTLKAEDQTVIGNLRARAGSAWGLGPLFRRRGGEPGDYLVIVFDSKERTAMAQIGDASLVDTFRDDTEETSSSTGRSTIGRTGSMRS
jgi:hypothetical protein